MLALCDVTRANGPTALQLGTHRVVNPMQDPGSQQLLHSPALALWQHAVSAPSARLAYPELAEGDVLVYSSALVHRGEANTTGKPRPILVYRYDGLATPPPGVGMVETQLMAWAGAFLAGN